MANNEAVFTNDTATNKLTVVRSFNAPLEKVWEAWSDSHLLDQWWAPSPYRAESRKMDFREGGQWFYSMVGPKGDRHFNRVDYKKIAPFESVTSVAMFCDENGNEDPAFPKMHWLQEFAGQNDSCTVTITLSFDSAEGRETYLKMGFREGFTAGLSNLDLLLAKS